jgi:D-3-phosphoglycerate dehydrogenase
VAVLDTRYPDLAVESEILAPVGVELIREDGWSPEAIQAVGHADVIIVGARARFDATALEAISTTAIIRSGIGVDNVDIDAAADRGILVCNVPDYGTEAVSQHALAMALAGTRRLLGAHKVVSEGGWGFAHLRPMHLPSTQTAAVIGLGKIGRRTAELFAAVGFSRVLGYDPYVSHDAVEQVDLETLLREADVISLHVPGVPGAAPLLGAEQFAMMRAGSVLVNTARGALIDEPALARGLASGAPGIAALDVYVKEPADVGVFAEVVDQMIFSPHQAWYTEESQRDLRRKCAEEALRVLSGQAPRSPVNQPKAHS